MTFSDLAQQFLVWLFLLFSSFSQTLIGTAPFSSPSSGPVVVSAEFRDSSPQPWTFLVTQNDPQAQQTQRSESPVQLLGQSIEKSLVPNLGITLKWDRQRNLLRIGSSQLGKDQDKPNPIHIKIETQLPVELEGDSLCPVTIVASKIGISHNWSSPSLTFDSNESTFSNLLRRNRFQVLPTGVVDVQTLKIPSGEMLNEGRIFSSGPLGIEILEGKFHNLGIIESQGRLYFKGNHEKKSYFLNSGRIVAPEIEVGSFFDRFYSFRNFRQKNDRNATQTKCLINSKRPCCIG